MTDSSDRANPLWGGQYAQGPAEALAQINPSIAFDKRLYRQDIEGSLAHAAMLRAQGILTAEDEAAIAKGLRQVREEIENGDFVFKPELEDIHMNIEARLRELIGEAAGRLHTARSRNDQVATDFRMWLREQCDGMVRLLNAFQRALLVRAAEEAETVMPGLTHLQSAQPVTLGHHLLAYVEMAGRDAGRFADCRARLNECPLGAAALAGTGFPIDREQTAQALGFDQPTANSLDSVASRDAALEFLAAAAICAQHLSRLAEEFVNWSSTAGALVRFSDAFSTGSSIMPQKRNPDGAELVRGKTGRVVGSLVSLLVTLKSLPLAYNKDMQEDKEPAFDAADQLAACLSVMTGMVADFTPDRERMRVLAGAGYATATDLADWLVREAGLPFREAHHATARMVKEAGERGCALAELPLEAVQKIEPRLTQAALDGLSVEGSVAARTSYGGTAPVRVREQIRRWQEILGEGI